MPVGLPGFLSGLSVRFCPVFSGYGLSESAALWGSSGLGSDGLQKVSAAEKVDRWTGGFYRRGTAQAAGRRSVCLCERLGGREKRGAVSGAAEAGRAVRLCSGMDPRSQAAPGFSEADEQPQ